MKTNKKMGTLFIERAMAAHTSTKANEDMAGTIVESDSDGNDFGPQSLSKPVVTLLSDNRV